MYMLDLEFTSCSVSPHTRGTISERTFERSEVFPKSKRGKNPGLVVLFPFVSQESEAFTNLPLLFLTHTKTSGLIEVTVVSLFLASLALSGV